MGQEENDIEQLIKAKKDLANVYKSQVIDDKPDDGNLTLLNESILKIQAVIIKLQQQEK